MWPKLSLFILFYSYLEGHRALREGWDYNGSKHDTSISFRVFEENVVIHHGKVGDQVIQSLAVEKKKKELLKSGCVSSFRVNSIRVVVV